MKKILYYICLLLTVLAVTEIKAQEDYPDDIKRLANIDNYTNRIVDNGENLWVLTNKGIVSYDKATGICIKADTELGISRYSAVVGITSDKAGNLWMGTKFDDAFMYNGSSTTQYKASINTYPWGPIYYCFALAFDTENNPWGGGFSFFCDFKGNMNYKIPSEPVSWWIGYYTIMDMDFDSNNKLWMAVNYGYYITLLSYEKGGGKYSSIVSATSPATSLVIDKDDNIWFVCADGIHCYNQTAMTDNAYNHASDPEIPEGTYIACDNDNDGNLWFASDNNLVKYDRDKFSAYTCPGFEKAKSVLCDGQIVWVYTANDELLRFENGEFTRHSLNTEPQGVEEYEASNSGFSVTCNNGIMQITAPDEITGADIYRFGDINLFR